MCQFFVFFIIWQVIYGDTDSIMIYSGLDDCAKAKAIAVKVIQEVNFIIILKYFLNIIWSLNIISRDLRHFFI